MPLIRTHRALHIARRRTHHAYAEILHRGTGVHAPHMTVPTKKSRMERKLRKMTADEVRRRRANKEYHRGL
jgi:hypothetical protein